MTAEGTPAQAGLPLNWVLTIAETVPLTMKPADAKLCAVNKVAVIFRAMVEWSFINTSTKVEFGNSLASAVPFRSIQEYRYGLIVSSCIHPHGYKKNRGPDSLYFLLSNPYIDKVALFYHIFT
jgi:hypothetical protein